MSNTPPSVADGGPNTSAGNSTLSTNGMHASSSNAIAVSLLEAHFNSLADRLAAEVALVSTYERKIPVLREGSVLLDEDVMELTRRLDKAQRLLIQKEAERMFIENMAEFIRERTMDTQREMDDIRVMLAQVSPGFVPSQPHSLSARMASPTAPMPQSSISGPPPQQQHHSSTHSHHHLQQQQLQQQHQDRERERDRDRDRDHSHSHSHSHSQRHHAPPPAQQHAQSQSMQATEVPCVEFNKLGCTNSTCRLHRCLRCNEKHTTFECPLNVESYFSNPSISRIYSLYKSKVIIVRHEPYNSRYGSGGGGGGGSSKSVGSSRSYREESGGGGGGDRWVAADRDRDRDRTDRGERDRDRMDHRSSGDRDRERADRDRDDRENGSRRDDEYRKRIRDDDAIGTGSSWRSGEDRGGDDRVGGDLKRARNTDEEGGSRLAVSGSSGGGRYSKRRDDESSGKGTPPRRDDTSSSRRRERSPEKGFSASFEDEERKQMRERSSAGGLPPPAGSGPV
ncbi:hypothetical protein CcCBS67573_g07288 [Chytriomyces confervae]|uniref:Uncharacterized protein n=1 Tax=Chytriomyces confervae TaxID=246404 RepID=A0A507EXP9_9FUNG|nr:hypothetical protein CcCBS67573_g07288 [Chytriomyces confervae]